MSVYNFAETIVAGSSAQGGGVTEQSLKFNDDEEQNLVRFYNTNGNRKTWTWSGWLKRGNLGTAQRFWGTINGSSQEENIRFETSNKIRWYCHNSGGSAADNDLTTVAVFRDVSAWYHIQIVKDTTQSTAANRNKLYVNGVLQMWSGTSYASQNYDGWINTAGSDNPHRIGAHPYGGTSAEFDGYMADVYFIDGQALSPTSFGETIDGQWKKIDYTGTYGTNGFKLNFQDDVVSEGFNAVTYRGTSPQSQSISGLGFSPDLVWIKSRSQTYNHVLADTVRGQGKDLYSNTTDSQSSSSTELISFDADGFSVGAGGSANDPSGSLGFVAWCWDAGSGSPVSNTDGTITSTVKANPDYGFSVVKWNGTSSNGATIGHGLGASPNIIMTKSLSNSSSWVVGIGGISGFNVNDYLTLQTTGAKGTSSTFYQSYDTNTFTVGVSAANELNKTGNGYISYCFAEVSGYSSIGTYSGTDSAGVTVTTGFRPAFVMIKATNIAENWVIIDNTRNPANPANSYLNPNGTSTEVSSSAFDIEFTDTGFVLNGTDDAINGYNGGTGEYIYMAFADTREAAFFKDVSGQNNHFTPIRLDYRDSLIDSPANNFATLNPLDKDGHTNSEGNLKVSGNVIYGHEGSTFSVTTGKWYFEAVLTTQQNDTGIGLKNQNADTDAHYTGQTTDSVGYLSDGRFFYNGSSTSYSSYGTGDVAQIAFDADTGEIWIGKNNTWQNSGDPAAGTGEVQTVTWGEFVPAARTVGSGTMVFNFGQDSTFSGATTAGGNTDDNGIGTFKYAPPAGYLALCTANLPTPTVLDPSDNFNTVLYTGNAGTQSITGVGFSPDWIWAKNRVSSSYHHDLYDSVRGDNLRLNSSQTAVEATGFLTFDADGFSLTAGGGINASGNAHVAWNWKAGGTPTATNSAGVGNVPTSGSVMIDGVASTTALNGQIAADKISANTKSGFSIVSYTGTGSGSGNRTVNHGLTKTPEFIILKDRDSNSNNNNWNIWHKDAGDGDDYGYFTTAAFTGNAQVIGTDNNVFTLKPNLTTTNESGDNYITYLFHSVEGYSKIGSYTGNGSTDGSFVYTGFRPAWIMWKSSTQSGAGWYIVDTKRNPTNEAFGADLYAQSSDDEPAGGSGNMIDINSNGFKHRSNRLYINGNGASYIYMAFAESPFKNSNAR